MTSLFMFSHSCEWGSRASQSEAYCGCQVRMKGSRSVQKQSVVISVISVPAVSVFLSSGASLRSGSVSTRHLCNSWTITTWAPVQLLLCPVSLPQTHSAANTQPASLSAPIAAQQKGLSPGPGLSAGPQGPGPGLTPCLCSSNSLSSFRDVATF